MRGAPGEDKRGKRQQRRGPPAPPDREGLLGPEAVLLQELLLLRRIRILCADLQPRDPLKGSKCRYHMFRLLGVLSPSNSMLRISDAWGGVPHPQSEGVRVVGVGARRGHEAITHEEVPAALVAI